MNVKIINKSNNPLPQYQTENAAGMDLMCNTDAFIVKPMEICLVPTGIFLEIPIGFEGQVRARSGTSIKKGLTLVNCVGTIDSDYRGELKIPIINLSGKNQFIIRGDKIAQIVFAPVEKVTWEEVSKLSETERGAGGFGSTGV